MYRLNGWRNRIKIANIKLLNSSLEQRDGPGFVRCWSVGWSVTFCISVMRWAADGLSSVFVPGQIGDRELSFQADQP